jgi:hypothetical protein
MVHLHKLLVCVDDEVPPTAKTQGRMPHTAQHSGIKKQCLPLRPLNQVSSICEAPKDTLNQAFKRCQRSAQAKRHNSELSQSLANGKRCFLFVSGQQGYLSVPTFNVLGRQPLRSCDSNQRIVDPRWRKTILLGDVIQLPGVHTDAMVPFLLVDKHDWRRPRAV